MASRVSPVGIAGLVDPVGSVSQISCVGPGDLENPEGTPRTVQSYFSTNSFF